MRNIEFLTVSVEALRKNPWNTNKVTPANESKIRASLERNGMFKPIIVRQVDGVAGFEILGGEHRWEQAIELGATDVPVANLGFISDKQAKEIGVIDNARYGADDTLSFAELLKELGDVNELQDFLPYGSADLDAIFSASSIALDDLEIDENLERELEEHEEVEKPAKLAKTHTVMRFKLSLGDAEKLTALISKTQKVQGLTAEDDLTNAGDALVHLLSDDLNSTVPSSSVFDEELDELLKDAQ
ncbi:ParB/RepB/Spo0J family partition protein [Agrobacterium sp. CG674]